MLGADGLGEVHLEGSHVLLTKYQTFLTKYGIACPFKRNMVTAEGQHFICPLNMRYIMFYRVIQAFRGLILTEKRVLQDIICCPSDVNKCPFKRTYHSIFCNECLVLSNIICCPLECVVLLLILSLWALHLMHSDGEISKQSLSFSHKGFKDEHPHTPPKCP